MTYDPNLIPEDLDPEERAAAELTIAELARLGPREENFSGDFLVRRRFDEVIYVPIGIMLAVCLIGLQQAVVGVALGAATIGLFAWLSARRIARFSISRDGVFSLPGRLAALDWSRVVRVDFGWVAPWGSNRFSRVGLEALDVSFGFADGTVTRLARGPLWRVSPTHEPIAFISLGRWLADRATAAGMVLTRRPEDGWTAIRG